MNVSPFLRAVPPATDPRRPCHQAECGHNAGCVLLAMETHMFLFDNYADDGAPAEQMGQCDLPDTQRQQSDNLQPYVGDRHWQRPERQFSDSLCTERQALG